eukprot:3634284-Pyramimonas_sp.AAC.1
MSKRRAAGQNSVARGTPLAVEIGALPRSGKEAPRGLLAADHAQCLCLGPRGEKLEKAGNWTQREKRGRVSGVLMSATLPLYWHRRTRKTK